MRTRLGVVALALGLAACKRTTTEPTPTTPTAVDAPVRTPEPAVVAAPVVLGHAMCVSLRACRDVLEPILARTPLSANASKWYETSIDQARAGGVLLLVVDGRIAPVGVLPLLPSADTDGDPGDHPVRVVGDHVLIAQDRAAVDAAVGVPIPIVQSSPALLVDGRIELAALPSELREAVSRRIAEQQAGTDEVMREIVPFQLAIDALAQADTLELDVLRIDGHLELDAVVRPHPGTRLAERAAANANPRTRLAAVVPSDALVQAGMVERIALPAGVRDTIGTTLNDALAQIAVAVTQTPGTETRKKLVAALATDGAELLRNYLVRDQPVEVVAFLPAGSTTIVGLVRGIEPALAERIASNLVALARDQGIKSAHTTRERGITIHGVTIESSKTHELSDKLGHNAIVRAAVSGDTLVVVLGGDRKPTDLRKLAKTLARAGELPAANRWLSFDLVALGRLLELDNAFVKSLLPTEGTIAASLTSDGRAWQLRMRMDALSPTNIAREMKEKSP